MDGEINLYRNRTYGKDAAVIVTDARSFRDAGLPAANPLDPASVTNFIVNSFTPTRTMLGRRQIDQLKADLLGAQAEGVTWKFVHVPEPMQNFGVLGASDRFEGYAAERTETLKFIDENNIDNVVVVAADIHGTVVSNLTYQNGPGQPQIATNAFEITTGAVAFDAPFGPSVYNLALGLGVVPPQLQAAWATGDPATREFVLQTLINGQIATLGYDPIGLNGSGLNATLLAGRYIATQSYGWTEFNIDPNTQELLVTTWGIPSYTQSTIGAALNAQPQIVSQFRVAPIPEPMTAAVIAVAAMAAGLRRRRVD